MRGEKVKKIGDLFEGYRKRLVAPELSVISAFGEVVEELLDIKLNREKIKYNPSNKTLYLTMSGVIKNEIKLNEADIKAHLKGRLGVKNAPQTIL